MVRKQVKALTVLYLVPCQHFGVYFAPYQILLVMGAVFVLLAIPFLLFYDRTVLPLCNRCLPRQGYPLEGSGTRPLCQLHTLLRTRKGGKIDDRGRKKGRCRAEAA